MRAFYTGTSCFQRLVKYFLLLSATSNSLVHGIKRKFWYKNGYRKVKRC